MKTNPVIIVSAFGRGQSLAARLSEQEIPTLLIDVSETLGSSGPEDEEGPFGIFPTGLSQISLERIHQDDPPHTQEEGWTFVLKNGPLEMKSPLTKTRLEKMQISPEILEAFRDLQDPQHKNLSRWTELPLEKNWLLEVAASLASPDLRLYPQALKNHPPMPLNGDFWIRSVTRPGLLQSLNWCERKGITVHRDYVLKDVVRQNSASLRGLQFHLKTSATTEILNFEKIIWCLSSEETKYLSEELSQKLFPNGILTPAWVWTRFRLRIPESPERDILPFHSAWIGDLELPWTHENLILLQKSPSPDLLDAWIRIPFERRQQRPYLQDSLDQVIETLSRRFVTVKAIKAEEPLSAQKSERESGPTRQPIFDSEQLRKWSPLKDQNFHLHAPETWGGLGWNHLFQHEEKLFSEIQTWWKKREELRIKNEMKLKGKTRD